MRDMDALREPARAGTGSGDARSSARVRWLLPDDPEARRRRDRWLLALGILLALALVVRAARKQDGVLVRNQEWGARFVAGEDPYFDPARGHRIHGPYPPSYALVCAPLSLLPEPSARVAWAVGQVGALAAAFALVRRWLARAAPGCAPHAPLAFAAGLVLASRFVLRDMAGGGGNLLYATAALWGLELALAKRPLAGALLVALPLALKPNLAPLALALLLRGRWRAFALAGAMALALAWLPGLAFGAEAWGALWWRWIADVLAYTAVPDLARTELVPDGFPHDADGMNQSLRAALGRVLPAGNLVLWTARAAGLGVLALAAWAAWRARGAQRELLGALALLPAALLASPITWKAHHAVLLPLLALLAALALERRRWSPLASFLALYWLACGLASEEVVGSAAKEWLQQASVVTWFTLALLAVTASWRSDPPDG
jgi:hypothetical protein